MLIEGAEASGWASSNWERSQSVCLAPARAALRSLLGQAGGTIGLGRTVVDTMVARAEIRHLREGRTIFAAGGRADRVHFLVAGVVRSVSGNTVVRLVPAGNFLDVASMLADDQPRRFSAVTHTRCVIAELGVPAWRALVATMPPDCMRQFAGHACTTLADLVQQRTVLARLSLRERVQRQLLVLARDFGREHPAGTLIDLPFTHLQLAQMIAATRANVTRAVGDLAKEGWLMVEARQVVLRAVGTGQMH